jgi:hypothetical protein
MVKRLPDRSNRLDATPSRTSPGVTNGAQHRGACWHLSFPVTQDGLVVTSTVENAFDDHGIRRDDERYVDSTLEPGHPQSGKDVIALRPAQGKRCKPVAEADDTADIAVSAFFARMRRDILMQLVYVAFGKWCENDPHKDSPRFLRSPAGLDAAEHRVGGNSL